ncbi:MAG TPA: DNA adenine methylase [Candidatus Competibacteraceae bacterium]|nr:DNA adenine methylase [Candidatus Competibacteraceae bacterium]
MNFPEQQSLFIDSNPIHTTIKPVNVASVPQRSPFRYPGGKTWFVPTFRRWVQSLSFKPDLLIEPFAGGGIISLTALFENLVEKVVMIEKDSEVAAVWEAVMAGHTEWLADRILHFDLSHENLAKELKTLPTNVKEKAFQAILKNRTLHGGILAEGSGLLKNGENGKGIKSRWYPQTLAKRVLNLNVVKERMFFFKADALEMLPNYAENNRAIFFIDPPYTVGGKKAGKRLYRYSDLDHERLFQITESLQGDFLMTYDHAEEVKNMARKHGFQMRMIPMNNTHHAQIFELIIGKRLSWLDNLQKVYEKQPDYSISEAALAALK